MTKTQKKTIFAIYLNHKREIKMLLKRAHVISLVFFSFFTVNLFAKKLTESQKKELWEKAQITVYDDKGTPTGLYQMEFITGSEDVTKATKSSWEQAKKMLQNLVEKDFWKQSVCGDAKEGLNTAKCSFTDHGLGQVPNDFRAMLRNNKESEGTFGALPQKMFNGCKFMGNCAMRTAANIAFGTFGLSYALIAPTVRVLSRPLGALVQATIPGTVVPVAVYSWNSAMWQILKRQDEPQDRNSSALIYYTKLNNAPRD